MTIFLLGSLLNWAPFRVDALGLVTLIGADQVDRVQGQLAWNYLTEWLPILGAHIFATDHITEPITGFTLYNITDGILATDVAGWFSRWLLCEDLKTCSNTIQIIDNHPISVKTRKPRQKQVVSAILGALTFVPIILSVLIGDWWGLTNGVAMLLSVLVRRIILQQNRCAIDIASKKAKETSCEMVKALITLPNGKIVTLRTTREIIIDCILTTPRPPMPRLYQLSRVMGWAAFGVHVIALGMACLFIQITSIVLFITATVIVSRQIGTDRKNTGNRLSFKIHDTETQFRAAAYARLQLTPKETNSMVLWNLFPHRSNKTWWAKYHAAKAKNNFTVWDTVLSRD